MTYIIKPEFDYLTESDAVDSVIISEDDLEKLAHAWDTTTDAIRAMTEPAELRRIYVAIELYRGDEHTLIESFDLRTAHNACLMDIAHSTYSELEESMYFVEGYDVPCTAHDTAKEAFHRWSRELNWLPDPAFYEDIYPDTKHM